MYRTLETLFAFVLVKPDLFGRIVGSFIKNCGNDRLLFATGNNLAHPDPLLKTFMNYRLSEDVMRKYDLKQLSEQDRRNILGLNAPRLPGLHPAQLIPNPTNDQHPRPR